VDENVRQKQCIEMVLIEIFCTRSTCEWNLMFSLFGFREIEEGEEVLSAPKALPRTPPPPGSVNNICKQYFNFLCLLFFRLLFSLQDNNEFVEVRENYDMPSMKSDL
jgi:hypothetical protein